MHSQLQSRNIIRYIAAIVMAAMAFGAVTLAAAQISRAQNADTAGGTGNGATNGVSNASNMSATSTSMATSTATSTVDVQMLLNRIIALERQVGSLRWQLDNMLSQNRNANMNVATTTNTATSSGAFTPGVPATGGNTSTSTSTSTQSSQATSTQATATIEPVSVSYTLHPFNLPNVIDFTGRNFGVEEDVMVFMNGGYVARAHADGGGNFSTGALYIPNNTTSTHIFKFTGMDSGITLTVPVGVTIGENLTRTSEVTSNVNQQNQNASQ